MKRNQRAKQLASVLYENSADNAANVNDSFLQVDQIISTNAQFRSLIQSKRLSAEQKTDIIRNTLNESIGPLLTEFLCIICKDRSVDLITQVAKAYADLYRKKAGIVEVQALVSDPLNELSANALKEGIQTALNMKTDLNIEVDDELLGGIKLRIENTFLDASLKSQLSRLQGELLQSYE